MRIWTIFWLVVVALLAVFTAANWQVLAAPTTISLVVAQVTAPLGLTLLGAIVGLGLVFLVFLVWLETRALVELGYARRRQESPAGTAVGDRRADLEREILALRAETGESLRNVIARFDHLEQFVREEAERARGRMDSQAKRAS